jgi:hypothetical protein
VHLNREGVRQLDPEGQPEATGLFTQPAQHRHGVGILQVGGEVVVVEGDIVEAEPVQRGAGSGIPQEGGIALDEGVEPLLVQEV